MLQISHAKTFKMKYTILIFIKSQRQIMCGSNFYKSDVSYVCTYLLYYTNVGMHNLQEQEKWCWKGKLMNYLTRDYQRQQDFVKKLTK